MRCDDPDPDLGNTFSFNVDIANALGVEAAIVYSAVFRLCDVKRRAFQEEEELRREKAAQAGKRFNRRNMGVTISIKSIAVRGALPWLTTPVILRALNVLYAHKLISCSKDDCEGTYASTNDLTEDVLANLKNLTEEKAAIDRYLRRHGIRVNC